MDRRLIIIAFILLLFTPQTFAATYYVANGGNDEAAGTSDGTAWATVAKVASTAVAGDTVYFDRQGSWSGASPVLDTTPGVTYDGITYTTSGSQVRAKLIATAYQDSYRQVVVRINGTSATTTTVKGFELDSNDLNLSGLAVGYGANASNVLVDNCVMHNAANSGWNYGMLVSYGSSVVSSVTVQNCEVYDFAQELVCLYPTSGGSATNVTIRNNTIHDGGTASAQRYGIGIILKNTSSNVIIEYNTIYNCNYAGIWMNPAANGTPVNAAIRYNLIYNNHAGIGWQHSDGNNNDASANIYGNILYNNNDTTYNLAYFAQNMRLGGYDTINVYNNTIYETGEQGSGAVVPLGGDGTINFRNNIVYTTNAVGVYDSGGYLTHSDNLIYRASGNAVTDNGSSYTSAQIADWDNTAVGTDPALTGNTLPTGFSGTYGSNMVPNTDYFQLTVDSPAKDTGATLEGYTGSINGAGLTTPIVRPLGAAFDIGAYEYGSVVYTGNAWSGVTIKGATCGAAGATCTGATNQLESFTANGEVNLGAASANLWRASEIVYAGTTGTLCKLVANVNCTTEDCTQVITGKLYSDNGSDEVNTLVGSCTGTYDSAALSTSDTDIDLTSCSGTITNGTKYWLVLTANSADGTNYIKLSTDSTCTTEKVGYSADGSTWTYATGTCGVFKIYILE